MRPRPLLVALVALSLALAGCSVSVGGPDATTTLAPGDGRQATVTSVVDGDTIEVRFDDGSTDTVRLLGIDTPETHAENTPAEFEGVPDSQAGSQCLGLAGERATDAVVSRIEGTQVRIATDPAADRRGSYGRLLAYVVTTDGNLNEWLVAEGHARVYDSTFSKADAFYAAESTAQAEARGLWDCRDGSMTATSPTTTSTGSGSSGLAVVTIHEDAAGHDGDNLTDEYVVLANTGTTPIDLGGWTVHDDAGHVYTVPSDVTLAPQDRLRLVTGSGTDERGSDDDWTLYWERSSPVWNNDGDVVRVRDGAGGLVVERDY